MARWCALDHAETYHANAVERRNRGGGSTVTVYKTARAMDEARGGSSEGFQAAYLLREHWKIARDDALYALRVALFGDVYEGVEL